MAAYEEAARRIPMGEGAQVIVAGGGAGGIAAAVFFGYFAALIFKPRMKS